MDCHEGADSVWEKLQSRQEARRVSPDGAAGGLIADARGAGSVGARVVADCRRSELDEPVRDPVRTLLALASLVRSGCAAAMVLPHSEPLRKAGGHQDRREIGR